jgi:hypothetical protein
MFVMEGLLIIKSYPLDLITILQTLPLYVLTLGFPF